MTAAQPDHSASALHKDPHLIAGRYRMHTRIGHGRLGEIYAAIDERDQKLGVEQHVAIQIIPESIVRNNKLFNKINVGFTLLRAASHPNIVRLLHYGRDARFGFLVMELLDGASLRLVLDESQTLPLDEAKTVIRGIGAALRFLHAKDMVHGNLTTRNVFINDNLEARLLDIVPLDAAEATFRGGATSEPFNRCTVEDDVFGLACLSYEILAGKHPFNHSAAAEARLAGLEAERIDSLSDDEWHALRLALSCDRAERTSSVAEFMRDFGITGTERLRPTSDQAAVHESIEYPVEEEASPASEPDVAAKLSETAAPVTAADPMSWFEDLPPHRIMTRKRARSIRIALLGLLLASLGAWIFFGEPEEHFVAAIGYIDENLDLRLTRQGKEIVELPAMDSERSAVTAPVTPLGQASAAAPAAEAYIPAAESPSAQPGIAVSAEDIVAKSEVAPEQPATPVETATAAVPVVEKVTEAAAEPAVQPAPGDQADNASVADASNEVIDAAAEGVAAEASVDTTPATSELLVSESVITVSEHAGAARIVVQNTQNLSTPLFWWTSADTAIADEDFIGVNLQSVTRESNQGGITLHVPLINDNLPERRESFVVNIARDTAQQGQIELLATVRVEIIDDDLR